MLRVASPERAAAFYERLGLRPVWVRPDLAILELRGGTHLLLFPSTRQRGTDREATFDLMADDLDAMHQRARRRRLVPSAIDSEERSGHRFFTVQDPDGHRVTIYSSHTEGRAV